MSSMKRLSISRLAWAFKEIEVQVCPPSVVFMTPASRLGNCVPEAKTTPLDGDDMPQIALGSGGKVEVRSVQVRPSCVLNRRWLVSMVPTQPSVALVKPVHRSHVPT